MPPLVVYRYGADNVLDFSGAASHSLMSLPSVLRMILSCQHAHLPRKSEWRRPRG